jgi:predicted Zn-dependent protease
MNISGNMNDIWMRLVEVGNDIIESSSQKVPSLMLDAIDFSGI